MHLTYIIENYFNKNYKHQDNYPDITTFLENILEVEGDEQDINIFSSRGGGWTTFSNFSTPKSFASSRALAFEILTKIINWDEQALQSWKEMQEIKVTNLINALTNNPYDFNQQATGKASITYNPNKITNLDQLDQELAKTQAPDYGLMYEGLDNIYKEQIIEACKPNTN